MSSEEFHSRVNFRNECMWHLLGLHCIHEKALISNTAVPRQGQRGRESLSTELSHVSAASSVVKPSQRPGALRQQNSTVTYAHTKGISWPEMKSRGPLPTT